MKDMPVKIRRAAAILFVGAGLLAFGVLGAPSLLGLGGGGWSFKKKAAAPTPEIVRLEGVDLLPGSEVLGFLTVLVNGSEAKFARALSWGSPAETLAAFQRRIAVTAGVREIRTTTGEGPNVKALSSPISEEYGFNLALLSARNGADRSAFRASSGPFEGLTWLDAQGRRIVIQATAEGARKTLYLMAVYKNPNVLFGNTAGPADNPGFDLNDVPRPMFARRVLSLAGTEGQGFGLVMYEGRTEPASLAGFYGEEMPKQGWKTIPIPQELHPLLQGERGMTFLSQDGASEVVFSFQRGDEGQVYTLAMRLGSPGGR